MARTNGGIIGKKNIISLSTISGKKILFNDLDKCVSTIPLTLTASLLGHKTNLKFRGIKSIYLNSISRVSAQKMIMKILKDDLKSKIHALEIEIK